MESRGRSDRRRALPFAAKLGMDRDKRAGSMPRIDAIPFELEHKFMATLHKSPPARNSFWSRAHRR